MPPRAGRADDRSVLTPTRRLASCPPRRPAARAPRRHGLRGRPGTGHRRHPGQVGHGPGRPDEPRTDQPRADPVAGGPRSDGDRPRPRERHGDQRRVEPLGAGRPHRVRPAQRRGDHLVRRRRDHRLEQLCDRGDRRSPRPCRPGWRRRATTTSSCRPATTTSVSVLRSRPRASATTPGSSSRNQTTPAPWAHFGTISKHSVIHHRVRVTIRWSGADTQLQVRTAGLRYFEVQRRRVGGAWYSWGVTTSTQRTITWLRPYDHEVRVRARDRAGNWSSWRVIRINL